MNPKERSRGRKKRWKNTKRHTHTHREGGDRTKGERREQEGACTHGLVEKGEGENRNISPREKGSLSKLRLITLKKIRPKPKLGKKDHNLVLTIKKRHC
jgi:hypothetical protein